MKKFNIKKAILLELIAVFLLSSFLIYQNIYKRSIDAFLPNSETNYIKWVDFKVTAKAMEKAYDYDVASQTQEVKLNWIELLAYLGAKYGGDFSRFKEKDLTALVNKLQSKEESMEALTKDMKYYDYFYEAYCAVLGGLVGEYEIQIPNPDAVKSTEQDNEDSNNNLKEKPSDNVAGSGEYINEPEEKTEDKIWVKKYGIKAFLPIARYFPYNDYDDFGVSRTYGYKRRHLGHDMMGQVGSPIIAVESGWVEALGWNRYGGWRIGIRSFDGKRYYYYAHLRKNFPYCKSLEVGSVVTAGDVIGYLGRTGYSTTENTNNINTPHLHFGIQLIFDESQKQGRNEIWIDCYEIIKFLCKNQTETVKNVETKEWYRVYDMKDPIEEDFKINRDKYPNPNSNRSLDSDHGDVPENIEHKNGTDNNSGNDNTGTDNN